MEYECNMSCRLVAQYKFPEESIIASESIISRQIPVLQCEVRSKMHCFQFMILLKKVIISTNKKEKGKCVFWHFVKRSHQDGAHYQSWSKNVNGWIAEANQHCR